MTSFARIPTNLRCIFIGGILYDVHFSDSPCLECGSGRFVRQRAEPAESWRTVRCADCGGENK